MHDAAHRRTVTGDHYGGAGVTPDRAILPDLPAGTLVIGGHDHLAFDHDAPGIGYFHGGSWGDRITVIGLSAGPDGPA